MNRVKGWRPPPLLTVLFVLLALLLAGRLNGATRAADTVTPESKIEPLVMQELAAHDTTDFFIWMTTKADLTTADGLESKVAKGTFVLNALQSTAESSQQDLRNYLDEVGATYQPFYIANKILVRGGDEALLMAVAGRHDVAQITANHQYQLPEPIIDPNPPEHILAIESNITFINANDVWAMGYNGAGTVLAGNDTGMDWDHPALINHYRGWNGSSANHNYSWWDATDTYPTVPNDGHGHGTHTSGTMVGDDGGTNQIGVAPGAKVVHCKNMTNSGSGSDATFTECFQWDLAPWNLSGTSPDPAMAPDSINNSWGYAGGNAPQFEDEVSALRSAGIVVEVSAGNEGPSCATLRSPGDYANALTTGSVQHSGGSLPGTITGFSSRGASDLYPSIRMPDVMAPGQNIRSSLPGTGYGNMSGTSMAGPHTAALIGLIWDAAPALQGNVAATEQIIIDTAVRLTGQTGSNCGGNYTAGPNNDWGYGTIDALAAVQAAIGGPPPTPTNTPIAPTPTNTPLPPTPTNTPPPGSDIFFDNFESNLGWTVNPGGTDTATLGQWERGNPEDTNSSGPKQLGTTFSGSNDLVTGRLAGSSAGAFDIDGGVTSIRSPNIGLPSSGTISLSFRYYMAHGTNSSSADYLRVSVVGSTTTQVFQELGAANDDDAAWALHTVDISSYAGQTVYLRIEATDASTASLVEAAVDDVRITGSGGGGPTPTPPPPTPTPPPGSCVTYNSTNVPISLPNGTTSISSNLPISGAGTISDLNVNVTMAHVWVGDLSMTLSRSGTTVTIFDRPGVPASTYGCSGDNIAMTLDDEAAAPVENQCVAGTPTINGTFTPNNSLTAFDGQSGNGTWVLTVTDHYTSADAGTLNAWSIRICTP
jgi:subtilisin-like proprotein convertase family protein